MGFNTLTVLEKMCSGNWQTGDLPQTDGLLTVGGTTNSGKLVVNGSVAMQHTLPIPTGMACLVRCGMNFKAGLAG